MKSTTSTARCRCFITVLIPIQVHALSLVYRLCIFLLAACNVYLKNFCPLLPSSIDKQGNRKLRHLCRADSPSDDSAALAYRQRVVSSRSDIAQLALLTGYSCMGRVSQHRCLSLDSARNFSAYFWMANQRLSKSLNMGRSKCFVY